MNCRICKNEIYNEEIYGDWYFCFTCNRSIPIMMNDDELEPKKINPKAKIICESLFEDDER